MIKVKLIDGGGYVIGDGKLPEGFDPTAFMKRFMEKRITASYNNLEQELQVSLDAYISTGELSAESTVAARAKVDEALEGAAAARDEAIASTAKAFDEAPELTFEDSEIDGALLIAEIPTFNPA